MEVESHMPRHTITYNYIQLHTITYNYPKRPRSVTRVTQGKCSASSKLPSRAELVLDLHEPNTSKPPGALRLSQPGRAKKYGMNLGK